MLHFVSFSTFVWSVKENEICKKAIRLTHLYSKKATIVEWLHKPKTVIK